MGSTIDEIKCPQCKQPHAYYELYYKSGEEIIFCDKCGFHFHSTLVIDRKLSKQIKEKALKEFQQMKFKECLTTLDRHTTTKEFTRKQAQFWLNHGTRRIKLTKDGKCMLKKYERKGYGAYLIMKKAGGGQSGSMPADPTKRELLIKDLKKMKKERKDLNITASDEKGEKIV